MFLILNISHRCKNLNESSDYPITLRHLSVLNWSPDGLWTFRAEWCSLTGPGLVWTGLGSFWSGANWTEKIQQREEEKKKEGSSWWSCAAFKCSAAAEEYMNSPLTSIHCRVFLWELQTRTTQRGSTRWHHSDRVLVETGCDPGPPDARQTRTQELINISFKLVSYI